MGEDSETGYIGVGRVMESVQAAKEFKVGTPEGERAALEVLQDAERFGNMRTIRRCRSTSSV